MEKKRDWKEDFEILFGDVERKENIRVFIQDTLQQELDRAREEGILIGVFGKDNRSIEDIKADLEYLCSMGELSTDDYQECLSKLTTK